MATWTALAELKRTVRARVEGVELTRRGLKLRLRLPRELRANVVLPDFEKAVLRKCRRVAVEPRRSLELSALVEVSFSAPIPEGLAELCSDEINARLFERTPAKRLEDLKSLLTAFPDTGRPRIPPKLWGKVGRSRLLRANGVWYLRKSRQEEFGRIRWACRETELRARLLDRLPALLRKSFTHAELRDGSVDICDDEWVAMLADMMDDGRLSKRGRLLPIAEALESGDAEKARALTLSRSFWR